MVLRTQPKRATPVHVQKRRGEHHKTTTTHYVKTYWPYLSMALIVGLGLLTQLHWNRPSQVLGASTDMSASSLLEQTNIERLDHREPALTLSDKLSRAAQAKANDMAARNYWSHNTPEGRQPWNFVSQAGYQYRQVGENLAYGFSGSRETVLAWFNSSDHRKNLLGKYQDVGFGIATAPSFQGKAAQTVVVAMYGTPETIVTADSATRGVAPDLEVNPVQNMAASNLPARHVTRFETTVSGATPWLVIAVAALSSAALFLVTIKHGRLWRRAVRRGELFIVTHPVLDILIVAGGVAGYLLTRTSGFIH